MRIAELPLADVRRRLAGEGLSLDFGLLRARVRADVRGAAEAVHRVYGAFPVGLAARFHDISATLRLQRRWQHRLRPHVQFLLDGEAPFDALPAATHLPMLEWGMNWCVAARGHRHLLLHAGAIARDGMGILIPAVPGSGKSTLTAALMCRGYRLLSDEFGVLRLGDHRLLPLVRPVALKNESIGVIAHFAPQALLGPVFRKTRKGDVAHLAPDRASVDARTQPAQPTLILFPQFRRGAATEVEPVSEAIAFVKLSGNSFNYELLGERAFDAVVRLVRGCRCYRLTYGELDEAVAMVDELLHGCVQPLAVGQ
jgi:HprK-related kinase A